MERNDSNSVSFGTRMRLAWRVLWDSALAGKVTALLAPPPKPVAPAPEPPERTHAAGLWLLSALQREGRLVDFLQQDITGYGDEDVAAAARIVHAGSRKILQQYVAFQPAVSAAEGDAYTVPAGFDAQKIRLAGNVTGQPPFKGTLKHHGWVATDLRFPALPQNLDPRVVAPAEVELP